MATLNWFRGALQLTIALMAGCAAAVGTFFLTVAFLGLFGPNPSDVPEMPSEAELDKLINTP